MPFRRLPSTHAGRISAMQAATLKLDNLDGAPSAVTADVDAELRRLYPLFKKEVGERGAALGAQTGATRHMEENQGVARQLVSHFLQAFNNAVARGVFQPGDRAYYMLDTIQEALPPLGAAPDLLLWGQRVIDGEAARLAVPVDGQPARPITFPSIDEVKTAYDAFKNALGEQTKKVEIFQREAKDVEDMIDAADRVIMDVWDDVENTFRRLAPPAKRAKAREYGVEYAFREGEPPDENGNGEPAAPTPPAPGPMPPTP